MILDLFAGMGGWDEGLRTLGRTDVVGVELDSAACATRAAAGHATLQGDVAALDPHAVCPDGIEGLIASPPCQDFSLAGKRAGLTGSRGQLIHEVLRWAVALRPRWVACEQVPPALPVWRLFAVHLAALGYRTWAGIVNAADHGVPQTRQRAILMASLDPFTPPAATHTRHPGPAGLFGEPLLPWVSMAEALGWDDHVTAVWTNSDNNRDDRTYTRSADALAPSPTSRGNHWVVNTRGDRDPSTGGNEFPTDAPSWAMTGRARSWTVRTGNNSHVTGRTGSRAGDGDVEPYERPCDEPAPTLDTAAGNKWTLHTNRDQRPDGTRQTVEEDRPAATVTAKAGGQRTSFGHQANDVRWVHERPATTVQGDPRIGRPGHKDRDRGEAQFAEQAVKITVAQALILQGFDPAYPVQGSRTAQFAQIGNAIPVGLARATLASLV